MKLPSELKKSDEPIKKPKRKKALQLIGKTLLMAIGIALIAWFVSKSNPEEIWSQLSRINYRFVFLILVTFGAYMMVAYGWLQSFPVRPERLNPMNLFIIRQIGETLSQINPTNLIAGETLKAMLLKRRGIPYHDGIVSLTISRVSIILSAITLVLSGMLIFFNEIMRISGSNSMAYTMIIIFVLVAVIIVATYLMLRSGKGLLSLPILLVKKISSIFGSAQKITSVVDKMKMIDEELLEFFRTKKLSFTLIYLLALFHWIVGALEMYLILRFIGIDISFLSCVAVEVGVMVFKAIGSFVPGQVGIEEMANKIMLEFVAVSGSSIWVTVSILRRARQIFWIIVGFIAFLIVIRNTKELNNGSIVYNS